MTANPAGTILKKKIARAREAASFSEDAEQNAQHAANGACAVLGEYFGSKVKINDAHCGSIKFDHQQCRATGDGLYFLFAVDNDREALLFLNKSMVLAAAEYSISGEINQAADDALIGNLDRGFGAALAEKLAAPLSSSEENSDGGEVFEIRGIVEDIEELTMQSSGSDMEVIQINFSPPDSNEIWACKFVRPRHRSHGSDGEGAPSANDADEAQRVWSQSLKQTVGNSNTDISAILASGDRSAKFLAEMTPGQIIEFSDASTQTVTICSKMDINRDARVVFQACLGNLNGRKAVRIVE